MAARDESQGVQSTQEAMVSGRGIKFRNTRTGRVVTLDERDARIPQLDADMNKRWERVDPQQERERREQYDPESLQKPAPAAEDDYENTKVEDLKAELDKRELPVSGNKPELIARLREDDRSRQAAADEGKTLDW